MTLCTWHCTGTLYYCIVVNYFSTNESSVAAEVPPHLQAGLLVKDALPESGVPSNHSRRLGGEASQRVSLGLREQALLDQRLGTGWRD